MNDPKAVLQPFFITVSEGLLIFIFKGIGKMCEKWKKKTNIFYYLGILDILQQIFTYSKSTTETVEKGVKHVQNKQ